MAPRKLDFVVLNAFTGSMSGGNPAAVIYLENDDLSTETLLNIGRGLNQPIATFILPSSVKPTSDHAATFKLRWFITNTEVGLCGHGTLAAAHVLFKLMPNLVPKGVDTLEFETHYGTVTARPAPKGRMEMDMPTSELAPVSDEQATKIKAALAKAFGKDEVAVNYIGGGIGPRAVMLMVELDEKENLADAKINDGALVTNASRS